MYNVYNYNIKALIYINLHYYEGKSKRLHCRFF